MKDWIPLLVALVWPLTLAICLIVFQKHVRSIVRSVAKRIRGGADVKIGPFSLGDANAKGSLALPSDGPRSALSSGPSEDAKRAERFQAALPGVWLEIRLNEEVVDSMIGDLGNLLRGDGLIPLRRLNEKATAGLVQHPLVPADGQMINLSWVYLQEITMFNRLVDSIDNPTAPDDYRRARIIQALTFKDRLRKSGSELLAAIEAKAVGHAQSA